MDFTTSSQPNDFYQWLEKRIDTVIDAHNQIYKKHMGRRIIRLMQRMKIQSRQQAIAWLEENNVAEYKFFGKKTRQLTKKVFRLRY